MRQSLIRILKGLGVLAISSLLLYALWSPGATGPPPSSRGQNGAWLTHAWWGDDYWFKFSSRKPVDYRGEPAVLKLAERMSRLGVSDWYVHACPADKEGHLPELLVEQGKLLVQANSDGQVLAWVGGVQEDCSLTEPSWRKNFCEDATKLVSEAGLAGIHLNIEPCPSFEPGYLKLLDELRVALPEGSRLSIAAYPPPSFLHPFPEVHWNKEFYEEVSQRCDDMVIMAYDASQPVSKTYIWMVKSWTADSLAWSKVPVRIGLPAYGDDGVGYHDPKIENLPNALSGLAAGTGDTPENYRGWAVYAEWTLDASEEAILSSLP